MTLRYIPPQNKRGDWPRRVANQGNDNANRASALEARADALEAATDWSALDDYADDTAAAAGGVEIGQLYHTSGTVKVRLS